MSSLLPATAGGCGTRMNDRKRLFVATHLGLIEYRTVACEDAVQARAIERGLKERKGKYLFES